VVVVVVVVAGAVSITSCGAYAVPASRLAIENAA
jgi:hypothetical protein